MCGCPDTPIVIDGIGNGFELTSASEGTSFDINGDGSLDEIAWTSENSDDAWLALDRNGNGIIDDGRELFGNYTQQPIPAVGQEKNGFLALAVFDRQSNGGNNNRKIDNADSVFSQLRLWQDLNHNGFSEVDELLNLTTLGIRSIDLSYHESRKTDEYGNRFKYRAKVRDTHVSQVGRWAWDVILVRQE